MSLGYSESTFAYACAMLATVLFAGCLPADGPRVEEQERDGTIASAGDADRRAIESTPSSTMSQMSIDLQGHRGARGLLPENTIPSFRKAIEIGVNTLEMDVVVSGDRQVVVSHEPWFAASICRTPEGDDVRAENERSFNMYAMTYEEIAAFDCGSRGNPRFPRQQPMAVSKPLLDSVIVEAERYAAELGRPAPLYNIEIKSRPEHDGLFHPPPEEFARLLYDVLERRDVTPRATVQSFDTRALQAMRRINPDVRLALLVDNLQGFDANVERLGFLPEIYSPNYLLVSPSLVDRVHQAGLQILPWTVNEAAAMRRLLEMGVGGLITDYPDVGREVVDAFERGEPEE